MGKETKYSLNQIIEMFILFSLAVIGRVVICQDCFFKSSLYIGHVNITIDNVTCDRWDAHLSQSDPLTLKLPDVSTSEAANYCRDPDEKGHPWCYVSNDPHHKTWEFCDVLFCRECYFANRSHDYNGYVTAPISGKCLDWTGASFPDSSFPDGSAAKAKNYCRDPNNRGYPQCLTSHGVLPCLIPKCNASVCADDPTTVCDSLKFFICEVKDMAKKLCAKTCGMCGFSLMSPVHIKPPVHNADHPACEDNPMAKCDTLKQFICGTAQAAQLCPKTCNVCSANSTNDVRSTMSTTRSIRTLHPSTTVRSPLSTTKQHTCVDLAHIDCSNPDVKNLICIDPPAATNYCRKTCNMCDSDVYPLNVDSCGDPIKESMCKLLHDDVCICNDTLGSMLCHHYCANQCGPVNRAVTCSDPNPMAIVGRR